MRKIPWRMVILACVFLPVHLGAQATVSKAADIAITVTVLNHRPNATSAPRLSKDDVVVRQNGQVRPVLNFQRVTSSSGLDFAILIDDSLQPSVALQWKDVSNFIRELPKNSRVAVAYGTQGAATIAQPFTPDRELAIKSLRLPRGPLNASPSIYLSLLDLIRHMPADGHRHVVLLVSDGIDLFYGILNSEPGLNVNLQRAIDASQRDGVVVDSIYASSASFVARNLFLINNGQSCLSRLAIETGGTAYMAGLETPVSFDPYLKQIAGNLTNMYQLTFEAALPAKPGFARIQLSAEPAGIELLGPARVYLPASQ